MMLAEKIYYCIDQQKFTKNRCGDGKYGYKCKTSKQCLG
jgi:hypothetical protein